MVRTCEFRVSCMRVVDPAGEAGESVEGWVMMGRWREAQNSCMNKLKAETKTG